LVDAIARATSTEVTIEQKPTNPFTQRRTVLDPSKAKNELDWQPKTSFADGLQAVLNGK